MSFIYKDLRTNKSKKNPMEYALRILSMRDYSESVMRDKLTQKFGREDAEAVLEQLIQMNYINDLRYAENFTVSTLLAGYGSYAVIRKLREKGVDVNAGFVRSIATSRDIDTESISVQVMKKFLAKTKDEDRISIRTKCLAHMFRRGFDIHLAEIQFERLTNESDIS